MLSFFLNQEYLESFTVRKVLLVLGSHISPLDYGNILLKHTSGKEVTSCSGLSKGVAKGSYVVPVSETVWEAL